MGGSVTDSVREVHESPLLDGDPELISIVLALLTDNPTTPAAAACEWVMTWVKPRLRRAISLEDFRAAREGREPRPEFQPFKPKEPAMNIKSIPLTRKYEAHGKVFDAVSLRAPTLREYLTIGEPMEAHAGPDGDGRFIIEQHDRIAAYLDKLAVPGEPGLENLDVLDLADSMSVKEAIIGFFSEARRLRAKPTS
jgi:hypothetical protein